MKFNTMRSLAILAGAAVLASSYAAIVVDGNMNEAEYGAALTTQINETGFGNNNVGSPIWANGSELDGLFAAYDSGTVYIGLAGNLETNYNKYVMFFDSQPGGHNQLVDPQPSIDFGYLANMSGTGGLGLTFDTGFNADLAFNVTNGDTGGGIYGLFANMFRVGVAGGYAEGAGAYLGSHNETTSVLSGGDFTTTIEVFVNNSNLGGVGDGGGMAWQNGGVGSGAGVTTGAEWAIPWGVISEFPCDWKLFVALTGGGGEYWSNQILPGLDGTYGNLSYVIGNAPLLNMNNIAGNQYVWLFPSVSGQLTLNDYVGALNLYVPTVKWFDGNMNLLPDGWAEADANGNYKACGPIKGGAYTMCIKMGTFLSKAVAVDTTNGPIGGVNLSLVNGDVDEDDEIGPNDFSRLSSAFGSMEGDSNWDFNADLDKDGEVGPNDFSVLSANFGMTGDCP